MAASAKLSAWLQGNARHSATQYRSLCQAAELRQALSDTGPYVRAVAAEALARYGSAEDLAQSLAVLEDLAHADRHDGYVSLWALLTIGNLGEKAKPLLPKLKNCQVEDPKAAERFQGYATRVMKKLQAAS